MSAHQINPSPLLVSALLHPASCSALSLSDWDLLVRQARRANLLATLGLRLQSSGQQAQVPSCAWVHFESALVLVRRQSAAVANEVGHIRKALAAVDAPLVLLKGAAYLLSSHPAAAGRMFSDVDILVPQQHLGQVEAALMVNGWQFGDLDAYDSRYYRQWMHELPPLMHMRRQTTLDVHHTILPPTASTKINSQALFEDLVPVEGQAGVFVLSPEAMLLHSATHLFHEGEFDNGLRDLVDLDVLLRTLGGEAMDWRSLLSRAQRLGLEQVLGLALRCVRRLLGTPLPADLLLNTQAESASGLVTRALDFAYLRALRPQHASCKLPGSDLALSGLYIRSHYLRMPSHLLAYHLARKLILRSFTSPEAEQDAQA
ncbi:nucleotidyltransferase family protein [Paucibacter sp. Y2R2-4]|uniref:nucleotidyltransferase domain-containing protein n=1 Tax=Paucibacter sp. Y2R2-4 TaxID=2893553 RepID=UPI0021E4E198|nr:nucleotidyltransferase family protein [Paucibacter sp. Y2R2-4]MCV2350777.1 nucleotidyltransferase family protein [Paucibacter sp. Y2R2-4]